MALSPIFRSAVPQTSKKKSGLGSDLKQVIQLTDSMISEGINAAGDDQALFWRTLGCMVLDAYNRSKAGTRDWFVPGTKVAHSVKPNEPKSSDEYQRWEKFKKYWNKR